MKLVANEFIPMTEFLGASGVERFDFKTMKKGKTKVKMIYGVGLGSQVTKREGVFCDYQMKERTLLAEVYFEDLAKETIGGHLKWHKKLRVYIGSVFNPFSSDFWFLARI